MHQSSLRSKMALCGDFFLRHHFPISRQPLLSDSRVLCPGTYLPNQLTIRPKKASNTVRKTKLIPQISYSDGIKQSIVLIKEKLQSINDGEISISAYDTAWVALVRDVHRSDAPLFTSSLKWIINNQLHDGSWGDPYFFSAYDRLLCTLACVVALKTWNTYPEGWEKGMNFLHKNLHKIKDEDPEHQPCGFEVVFPTLAEMAQKLGLEGLQNSIVLADLYAEREKKLKKIPMEALHSVPTTLLHSLEGIPHLDWKKLMKFQHSNGSFLCSPSSTSHALMKTKDENCFRYLNEIVERFNGGVPQSYPMDIFERLWVVDRLERLGISRYFQSDIKNILDYVYRYWTPHGISWSRNTVELDIDDTSMGFRMLRLHGYQVKANVFHHFERDSQFYCFVGQTSQGNTEMLSLYRASQVRFPGENILEEANNFSSKFLRRKQDLGQVLDRWLITKSLTGEVQYYLSLPWYASLPRIETRYYIDNYGGDDDVWIAKVLYRMYNISNNLYLELAKSDYNYCQNIHQQEWRDIQMWYEKLNLRNFGLNEDALLKCYFLAMSSLFEPEQATARLAWSQTAVLVEVVFLQFPKYSTEQKRLLVLYFDSCIDHNNSSDDISIGYGNELAESILKTLSNISLHVQEAHGKEVYQALKFIWKTWLSSLISTADDTRTSDAEVLVRTINLCSGHFSSVDLVAQPKYVDLTNLINEICNSLRRTAELKVGRKKNCAEETTPGLCTKTIELQMQSLLRTLTDYPLDPHVKHMFLSVAKSYYYSAYCSPATIKLHAARVLFEPVV